MRDPSNLPFEIFDKILDEIVLDPAPGSQGYPTEYIYTGITAQQLHSSTLVSRSWHACSVPKFYSHWRYNGSTHGFARLWKFYCTIRSNQGLAMLVRSLCIEQWELIRLDNLESFSKNNNLIADGVFSSDRLGLEDILPLCLRPHFPSLVNHFQALMAVIMTYLPNLTQMDVITDHLDPCIASFLLKSARAKSDSHSITAPFQHLKEANFHPRSLASGAEDYNFGYLLENLWPVYFLPRIESFTISGVKNWPSSLDLSTVSAGTSSVTSIKLVHMAYNVPAEFEYLPISYDMARKILTLPKTLAKLSLFFNERDLDNSRGLTNAELWEILVAYQDSLQHLNVYRDIRGASLSFNVGKHHMGLLSGFKQLETLSIQSEALLGGCYHPDKATFRLKDTLPPSLRALTFYKSKEDNDAHTEIATQLMEVVQDKRHTFLRSIHLEDLTLSWWHPESTSHTQALEPACKGAKIELRIYQGDRSRRERIDHFPALQDLQRGIFYPWGSDFSNYGADLVVTRIVDLGYRSSGENGVWCSERLPGIIRYAIE